MTCPYCGLSSGVELVGVPTVARLIALAPALGLVCSALPQLPHWLPHTASLESVYINAQDATSILLPK